MSRELARAIEARTEALIQYSVSRSCTGAFWTERFGDRGQHHSRNDARYHIRELVMALEMEIPSSLEHYARWLQTVLTSRGMCTRHIVQHFEALQDAIRAQKLPQGETAVGYIQAGIDALLYTDPPARALQDAADELTDAVLARLEDGGLAWLVSSDVRDRTREDVCFVISYLADAIALHGTDTFVAYLRWIAPFGERHGRPKGYLDQLLSALSHELARSTSFEAARSTVESGRRALRSSTMYPLGNSG